MRTRLGSIAMGGLTPLLDTLFLLIFALLALSQSRRAEETEPVHLELPEVEAGGEAPATAAVVAIEIDSDSKVRLADGGDSIPTREALDRALARALGDALPEEVAVEIIADRDARHGVAVELLQHLRLRGFVDVRLVATGHAEVEGPFGGEGR